MTRRLPLLSDPRWQAVQARDRTQDGQFVYAVRSTGIYCRPSCPSRRPKPENVTLFDTPQQAEWAGFRPCQRCHPAAATPPLAERIAAVCRAIEQAEEMPSLTDLAALAALSPSHFHRQFKAVTGVTPRAYASAHRTRRVQDALSQPDTSITDAFYQAGFNSSGRFYEQAEALLGMTPTSYRRGGENIPIHFAIGETCLGAVLVARSPRGVCAILMGDDADALVRDLQDRFPKAELIGGDPGYEHLIAAVLTFIDTPAAGLQLPLDIRGTAFQQQVWQALQDIPPGQTATYAEIAHRLGQPRAVRAVAGACAANPLALAVPCHRVIRTDGGLSGYRWGIDRKRILLQREGARI